MIRPTVAVGGIAFDSRGRVLLIERGHSPGKGLWTIPGGKVEAGESLVDACAREMLEETGLEVEVGAMVTIVERMENLARPDGFHYVIVDFLVQVTGGSLSAASDVRDAAWVSVDDLATLETTAGLEPVLRDAQRLHGESLGPDKDGRTG